MVKRGNFLSWEKIKKQDWFEFISFFLQITIESLTHKSQHKLKNLFRDMKKLKEGMIIDGIIGHNGGWKLFDIIRVFPNEALPFIKKFIRETCS